MNRNKVAATSMLTAVAAIAAASGIGLPNIFRERKHGHCGSAGCRTLDKCICSCATCKVEKDQ